MLKFLEKGPISRWKFIQRLMHRRRNSRRSGSDKFKTFDTSLAPRLDSTVIIEHDANHHDYIESVEPVTSGAESGGVSDGETTTTVNHMSISNTAPEALAASQDTEKPIRRTKSDDDITSCDITSGEEPKSKKQGGAGLSLTERVALSRSNSARIKAWKDSHDSEVEPLTTADDAKSKTSSNQPFHRTSRLRSSLKELKKRSVSQMDSMRASVRRKVNTRKYDNLNRDDETADDNAEIVAYDRSPGTRRRQVIEL